VEVMMAMFFLEMLPPLPRETETATRQMLHDDIMRQRQTNIYQMLQFAERIKERGGKAACALVQKGVLRRLDQRIADRLQGLRSGT